MIESGAHDDMDQTETMGSLKDFEERWLSDLPSAWVEKRADFLCEGYRTTIDPESLADQDVAHYSIPHVQETGGPLIEPASDISSSKLLIEEPTLLVSKLNPRKKTICIAEPHGNLVTLASSEFVALRSREIDQGYAFYLWSSEKVTDRLSAIVQSATRSHQRVIPSDITKLPWRWPPLETQRRIARFLDEKTGRIDTLIARKRELLDRLAEKRQALITRAVTRGLDPDVRMKPSGVEWLGDIPAHWEVCALGYRYEVQLGRMLNADRAIGEHLKPYLRVFDVQWGQISIDDLPTMDFPPAAQQRYRLEPGDLLVNEGGSYVGRSAIWHGQLEECYYQKALHRLRPTDRSRDTAEFLFYVMEAATKNDVFVAGGNQTTIDHLTAEQLRRYRFAFPSLDDQIAIVETLGHCLSKHEEGCHLIQTSIDRLIEYRSALITAAVTGKLAVDAAAPTP